jgi:DNA repair exonuclease SbcCD nuclease subunit
MGGKILNSGAKRAWIISDTHLGVRNSSNEWIEIMRDYFNDWFIPLVKKNWKPGDVLLHLGDVYDSRQSINIKVLNLGVGIFESLSEIFPDGIYVIAGNHDLWGKNSNEINSLKSLKWIPNVTIFEEPETLVLGPKKFLMMPWRKDHATEEEFLDSSSPHDYLCCHADIRGLKFNRYVTVDEGADSKKFSKFGTVYSGHIHYSQTVNNIKMVGSPYELTRSDMGNPKGVILLDILTGEEQKFTNDFSPKFKKLLFDQILEMTMEQLEIEFKNNFIDVMIDPKMALRAPLNVISDNITSQKKLSFHPYDPDQASTLSSHIYETDGRQFSVMDFIREYVNGMTHDDSTKEKLIQSLEKLHRITIERDNESKI